MPLAARGDERERDDGDGGEQPGRPAQARPRRSRVARGGAISAPRAKPSWNTTHVSRITPPTRTTPASGPAAWAMPRLASGTPPNGNEKRSASTSVWAAGRPIARHRPAGAASAATPWKQREDRRWRRGSRARSAATSSHARSPARRRRTTKPEHGAPPARRALAEGELEQGDADERERPPAPRRQRQGDERDRRRGRRAPARVSSSRGDRRCRRRRAAAGRPARASSGSTRSRWTTMRSRHRARRVAGEQRGRRGGSPGRRSTCASGVHDLTE